MQSANKLLRLLPPPERERLLPHLRPVKLDFKKMLYRAGERIESVYFVQSGVASAMTVMENGNAIEVATVGNEGILGLAVMFAGGISPNDVVMQVGGNGLRIDAGTFAQEAREGTMLRQIA